MGFQRRRLLRILSFAFGSTMILSRTELGFAAQSVTPPSLLLPLQELKSVTAWLKMRPSKK